MKLFELDLSYYDDFAGYYDPQEDKFNHRNPADTRKDTITLRHLNRLKKIRAIQRLDNIKRQDLLAIMYGQPQEQGGGMGMSF